MVFATQRRLRDELNIETSLEFVYKFSYQAEFGDSGSENEFCHVFFGAVGDSVMPNDHEIDGIRYLSAADLDAEFERDGDQFTPWFKTEWQTLSENYKASLDRYTNR